MDCDLDVGAVAAWASGRVVGLDSPLKASRLAGGQSNPTYRLEAANGAWILRRLRWPALRQPISTAAVDAKSLRQATTPARSLFKLSNMRATRPLLDSRAAGRHVCANATTSQIPKGRIKC